MTPSVRQVVLMRRSSNLLLRAPTAGDDTSKGYAVGNYWLNRSTGEVFKATAVGAGAAAWTNMGVISTPILDRVTTAAAAYGVFLLRAAYAGNAFRVRRASDSTTLDIGFTAAGVADFAAADAFGAATTLTVCIWYDQSGNGLDTSDASTNAPALVASRSVGTTRGITFQVGGGKFFTLPAGLSLSRNNFTGIAIARPRAGYFGTFFTLGTTQFLISMDNAAPFTFYNGAQQPALVTDHTGSAMYGVTDDGTNAKGWLNDGTGTSGFPGASATMTGGNIPRSTGTFAGEMAAVIFYPTARSAADMALIQEATYSQVGIAPQIRDRVVFVGDSISAGYNALSGTSYAQAMIEAVSRPYVSVNTGVPSQTALEESTNLTRYTPLFRTNRKNVAFVFSGTNDIASNAASGATTLSYTNTICTAMKAAGFEVIVATMLPRVGGMTGGQTTGGFATERAAYNTALRSGYTAFADALCDFAADPTMGPDAAASDTTKYPDGIHPSPAIGHPALGVVAAAALAARG